ncbi:MAG: hypothetical protein ABJ139_06915 [Paracoccaceae bacterium]
MNSHDHHVKTPDAVIALVLCNDMPASRNTFSVSDPGPLGGCA